MLLQVLIVYPFLLLSHYMGLSQFVIYSPADGHLYRARVLTIRNEAALDIHVQIIV